MKTQKIDPADIRQLKFTRNAIVATETLRSEDWFLIEIYEDGGFLLGSLTPASPGAVKS